MNFAKIEAHTAEVNSISYLPAEDSFVSIGSDNSIRVWVENKMLRERFGHSLPPSYIGKHSNLAPLYHGYSIKNFRFLWKFGKTHNSLGWIGSNIEIIFAGT